jgi:rhodanese-related sulfurtransferase
MRFVLLTAMALGVVWAGFSGPRILVEPEVYEFGTVADGTVVEFYVTLTNAGNQRLSIFRVDYRCVCTSYELAQREIAPGESVRMKIRFNTKGYAQYAQPVSQTVTLHTNDLARPRVTITVRGVVRTLSPHEAPASALAETFWLLVDLRSPKQYAQGHLLGALNAPLPELEKWAEKLPKDRMIYLYDETGEKAAQAVVLLERKGFRAAGAIRGGLVGWWQELGDLFFVWAEGAGPTPPAGTAYPGTGFTVAPSRVARSYFALVDVRGPAEFKAGHIAGALHVPLFTMNELAAWAKTLPPVRPGYTLHLWIVDEDGTRACSIAAYLRERGYPEAKCLFGGMRAWQAQYGTYLIWSEP